MSNPGGNTYYLDMRASTIDGGKNIKQNFVDEEDILVLCRGQQQQGPLFISYNCFVGERKDAG